MRVIAILIIVLTGIIVSMQIVDLYNSENRKEKEMWSTTYVRGYVQGQMNVLKSKSKSEMDSIFQRDSIAFMRDVEKVSK